MKMIQSRQRSNNLLAKGEQKPPFSHRNLRKQLDELPSENELTPIFHTFSDLAIRPAVSDGSAAFLIGSVKGSQT